MVRLFSRSKRRSSGTHTRRHFAILERLEPRIAMDGAGIVDTNVSSSDENARAIALQADGQVVAAGYANFPTSAKGNKTTNNYDGVLVRYNSDGSLDTSLSGDGIQRTDIGSSDVFWELAIQSDQRIVAGGHSNGQMAVVRYLPDGSLDPSFDGDGIAFTSFSGGRTRSSPPRAQCYALELQDDEKIVVAGRVYNYNTGNWQFGVARFTASGALDSTFGGNGQVVTDFGLPQFSYEVESLAVQSDGRIIAAGGGDGYFLMARYNPDGTLDTTFDGDGMVVHDVSSASGWGLIGDIAIQPDGKIVAGGGHVSGGVGGIVARYNADGSLDSSFGIGGTVKHPHFAGPILEVELQSDGSIVVSGLQDWRVGRLNSDGSLDTSFGGTGSVLISSVADGADLLIQANDPSTTDDDKIVTIGDGNNFIVARLNNDGTFDSTWGGATTSGSGAPLSSKQPASLESATSPIVRRSAYASAVDLLLAREAETAALKPRRMRMVV